MTSALAATYRWRPRVAARSRFVAHRLDHYGAGHRMDYRTTSPRDLADAMRTARQTRPAYRPIRRGGADRAAAQLASVLTG